MIGYLRILILEDNLIDAEIVLRLLRKEGFAFEFLLVMNKEEFKNAINEFHPDVIISDNSLPQFSATEALSIIQEHALDVPFILVTGAVSEEFAATIIKLGADDYILKDRLGRLPAAIEGALEKKRSRAALRHHEDALRLKASLLAAVGQAVIATSLEGTVIYWNKTAEKIYGWSASEAIGKNIIELTPSAETKEHAIEIMSELQKGNSWSGEFLVKRKDGSIFPAFVTDSPIYNEESKLTGIIGVSNDITERKKSEQAFKEMAILISNQKVQEQKKIIRAVITAQEKQKNHIGKELHDNINQILAGAKLYLSVASKTDQAVEDLLKYPMELIDHAIGEIRLLSSKHVTPLKNINLEKIIRVLIENIHVTTPIKTLLEFNVTDNLVGDELKLNIYRIVQELINNIVKHADCQNILIQIFAKNHYFFMKITDDGQGFDISKKRKGIGLSNITDRVEAFNGEIEIQTAIGKGCQVSIRLPL